MQSTHHFMPRFTSKVLSDQGRKRTSNEDSYLVDKDMGLYIVCDGMGGHAAGEVASQLAVQSIYKSLKAEFSKAPPRLDIKDAGYHICKLIEKSVMQASVDIYQHAEENPAKRGMGTTITMCLVVGSKAFIGHVGDSRCYIIRGDQTYQITEDHSLLNDMIKAGHVDPNNIQGFAYPNALSRALGVQQNVQVDTLEVDLLPDDTFVLCSDGLHGYLDDQKVTLDQLALNVPFEHIPQILIDFANESGGKDNITALVLRVQGAQETQGTLRIRSSLSTLQTLQLFQRLDYKEYVKLFSICSVQDYEMGARIIEEGHPGNALYVVVDGTLTVQRDGQPLAELSAGQHFGEMSLIENSPRSATVIANERCSLLRIRREEFEMLIQQDSALGVKLMGNLLLALSQIVRTMSQKILRTPTSSGTSNRAQHFREAPTQKLPSLNVTSDYLEDIQIAQQYGDTVELRSFAGYHSQDDDN